jgi:hypothetical protein
MIGAQVLHGHTPRIRDINAAHPYSFNRRTKKTLMGDACVYLKNDDTNLLSPIKLALISQE